MTDIYRILTPTEYKEILKAIPKLDNRIRVETMMNTGMRYRELQEFGQHLEWFHPKDRCIVIPGASLKQGKSEKSKKGKKKITIRDRTVHLTPQFSEKLEMYLSSHKLTFPVRETMNMNLKRWHYIAVKKDNNGIWQQCNVESWILPKTFRKTWESWLLFVDYPLIKVARSQGHTVAICEHHYASMPPSLKSEVEAVKKMTEGWHT